jgi:hypothetical protein
LNPNPNVTFAGKGAIELDFGIRKLLTFPPIEVHFLAASSKEIYISLQASILPRGWNSILRISRQKTPSMCCFQSANIICAIAIWLRASIDLKERPTQRRYEITNLGAKIGKAAVYFSNSSATTYRLEIPHPDGSGGAFCSSTIVDCHSARLIACVFCLVNPNFCICRHKQALIISKVCTKV